MIRRNRFDRIVLFNKLQLGLFLSLSSLFLILFGQMICSAFTANIVFQKQQHHNNLNPLLFLPSTTKATTTTTTTTTQLYESIMNDDGDDDDDEDVEPGKMRVSEIKAELETRGIDYTDCFDKESLANRLKVARESGKADPSIIDKFNKAKVSF